MFVWVDPGPVRQDMAATPLQRARDADKLIERMEPPDPVANMLPKMLKAVPALMFVGLILVVAAFGLSITVADSAGEAVGHMREGNTDQAQQAQEEVAQLRPMIAPIAFVGMATLLFGISITLMAIAGALRTMGENLVGLILEHEGGAG